MRLLRCPSCERVTAFEVIEDSRIVDGDRLRCRSCLRTYKAAQSTFDLGGTA
jgi:predicted Zn finger-like uncharacterized protein